MVFQTKLPEGATLLGTILSSDKTNISAMTGNRTAHPLLLSLANIDMDFRMKGSNHTFVLLAILPTARFIAHKDLLGVYANRLYHECVSFVLEPLKSAARIGIMMSDPVGNLRYCFTPLVGFIADTPEERLVSCVAANTSPVTMASFKQFGDAFQHKPRTASTTLAKLAEIRSKVDPENVQDYFKEASEHHLNGVDKPFWRDWALAEPSNFLTPEPLHHLHKFFWDHEMRWCINVLTASEIDFRFSILQPQVGFRQFKEGITKLKQVTGREHREVQRHLVCVIAGGAAPKHFIVALRALMDFRYLAQAPAVDSDLCDMISASLKEFHSHKEAILEAGGRLGKKKRVINNWYIPKLELFQSVVTNIRANGANIQWSADVTEHAHITEIKHPADSGNNQNYEEQICRYLDRMDKIRRFDLATAIQNANVKLVSHANKVPATHEGVTEDHLPNLLPPHYVDNTASLLANIDTVTNLSNSSRVTVNYFEEAVALLRGESPNAVMPFRTFSAGTSAFHLNHNATFKLMTVDAVADAYKLPDLQDAIAHYVQRVSHGEQHIRTLGGRRPALSVQTLPFDKLRVQVWTRVRIQTISYFDPKQVLEPRTLEAEPPFDELPHGRYSSVLVNVDPGLNWPRDGIAGV